MASGSQQTLLVNTYDPLSQGTREHSYVTIESVAETEELLKLREKILLGKVVPDLPIHKTPFCTITGAEVSDKVVLRDYYQLLSHGVQEKAMDSTTSGHKSVYFKTLPSKDKNINMEGMDQFLKDKLDLKMTDKEVKLEPLQLKKLMSSYVEGNFAAQIGRTASNPATMSESDWDIVMRTNGLLYANKIVPQVPKTAQASAAPQTNGSATNESTSNDSWCSISIQQAKRPALVIKPRVLSEVDVDGASTNVKLFEVVERTGQVSNDNGNKRPNGKDNSKTKITTRIPRFQVLDGSSVEVFETKNRLASALAEQAFSRTEVEASIGGGAFGIMAEAKAGLSKQDQQSFQKAQESVIEEMHISYNAGHFISPRIGKRAILITFLHPFQFPRVVVYLDDDDLELSRECKAALNQLKAKNQLQVSDVVDFQDLFGQSFPSRIELGGRLYSSQESSSFAQKTKAEKSQAMKVAASLSFSSPYVQGSASASHEKSGGKGSENERSSLNNMISWQAQGGDTSLCNNPPAWCSTVGEFRNWRVMKQENFLSLLNIIEQDQEYFTLVGTLKKLTAATA